MKKPKKPKTRPERAKTEREAFEAGHRAGERSMLTKLASAAIVGFLDWAERRGAAPLPVPESKPEVCGHSPFLTWSCVLPKGHSGQHEPLCVLPKGHSGQHEPRKPTP